MGKLLDSYDRQNGGGDVEEVENEDEVTWVESLSSIFCCFRICQKTEFNEHGLGMYMASPSEVSFICINYCCKTLINYFSFKSLQYVRNWHHK